MLITLHQINSVINYLTMFVKILFLMFTSVITTGAVMKLDSNATGVEFAILGSGVQVLASELFQYVSLIC